MMPTELNEYPPKSHASYVNRNGDAGCEADYGSGRAEELDVKDTNSFPNATNWWGVTRRSKLKRLDRR